MEVRFLSPALAPRDGGRRTARSRSRYARRIARTVRIFSNGEYREVPPVFTMASPVFPDALLVFEVQRGEAGEYAPDYAVYSLPIRDERAQRPLSQITQGLTPVGAIPVSDVEFDEARGITMRTLGIERFAALA